jgi:formylglycine-generating enzyme required for sulfatase activity
MAARLRLVVGGLAVTTLVACQFEFHGSGGQLSCDENGDCIAGGDAPDGGSSDDKDGAAGGTVGADSTNAGDDGDGAPQNNDDRGLDDDNSDARPETAVASWELMEVPDGPRSLGAPAEERGRFPNEIAHPVRLTRDYWIMATEISQEQFEQVMGYNPSHFAGCGPTCPVEMASWFEFAAYANALSRTDGLPECYVCTDTAPNNTCQTNELFDTPYDCPGYRLPTEAEWEHAARAGTSRATYNGNLDEFGCNESTTLEPIAWFCGNSGGTTHPRGTKQPNSLGLFDMLGNVMEWCHDWYAAYPAGATTDPAGPAAGSARVLRGGSFGTTGVFVRAAFRHHQAPAHRASSLGARLVRTPR